VYSIPARPSSRALFGATQSPLILCARLGSTAGLPIGGSCAAGIGRSMGGSPAFGAGHSPYSAAPLIRPHLRRTETMSTTDLCKTRRARAVLDEAQSAIFPARSAPFVIAILRPAVSGGHAREPCSRSWGQVSSSWSATTMPARSAPIPRPDLGQAGLWDHPHRVDCDQRGAYPNNRLALRTAYPAPCAVWVSERYRSECGRTGLPQVMAAP
jgi:hypothetical protein